MSDINLAQEEMTLENIISLLDIYLAEWRHRDEIMWKQIFKFFYATMIVLFLPNIASYLQIDLPAFPKVLFPICALILSLAYLYVSIGYSKRLEASGNTYQKLIDLLPEQLKRVRLTDPPIKYGKYFMRRLSNVICTFLFFILFALSLTMIFYNLIH